MEKLKGLTGYMKHLEAFAAQCKAEEERIAKRRKATENRLEGIKTFLLPFVAAKGKVNIGTITLSTRKSKAVELDPDFNDPRYMKVKTVETPDKPAIKADLKAHPNLAIKGATLVTREHLQMR